MANRKKLKKEINYIHSELLSDCFTYLQFNSKQDSSVIDTLINKLADSHFETFFEINKPTKGMNRKEVKERYNQIIKSTIENTNNLYSELSKLHRE